MALQTPGLDPPPESAALFVLVTALGVVSYLLLRDGDPVGYPAAMRQAARVDGRDGHVLLDAVAVVQRITENNA